ncbi:30S ribosomal protein S20 [Acetobacterium carbinolicum]|jgi:small subunit ribosomal protein S20|uniref:30S ribosomal protein S20 n=1 Tax=Acetobacterium TaxID=33951 RepID=UPI000DBEB575|nr:MULTISPECIES: 30S ribosomal protein S20 [unclassified Acetobacterium]AWW26014.1 30S ribosomal protein S20 [Acetobacterium sp. KB-1]MDK2942005.1 small subunit ribosomal protein [Acetobacterium sp.]MDZ5723530.1 30S ribosomal protein S20 [Acetobacterium sp. K1/6]
MANIKSAMKRAKTNEISRLRNKMVKTNLKTSVKTFDLAVTEGNVEAAQEAFRLAAKKIDMAVTKGVLHKNTAARKKSTLARILNKMTA